LRADDEIRLRHMLDAAREAASFVDRRTRTDLDSDRMLVLALQKAMEIVGEAASRVSQETKGALADLPWAQIVAMRHRIVHGYDAVDADRLWDTVMLDVPQLIALLETKLPRD